MERINSETILERLGVLPVVKITKTCKENFFETTTTGRIPKLAMNYQLETKRSDETKLVVRPAPGRTEEGDSDQGLLEYCYLMFPSNH